MRDDLGHDVPLTAPATRVVSLVPSLTEALAASAPDVLVGATDWCTHPADLGASRVRGTKNPDLAAIRALSPDLVVANQEENRELDVRRLREAGVAVWVTRIETVEESLGSMSRLFAEALGLHEPPWLAAARSLWSEPATPRLRVAVPIWRDPWMVVGSSTYTDDLLARAGLVNVLAHGPAEHDGRYPTVTPAEIDDAGADVVLLPDEPYVFTESDGPEALRTPTRLVSGRLLTWYGPAMVEAHGMLAALP
ncbi:cobalamin-binding protein [Nocardioides glacieisoli]|uniref:Cobalamin-binding protein n=1 Tax=Nocardioides glacieisoli TaxID=1168730 RepID=A0A4Q2RSD1_9ACTN|nr:helical backbone metal receptor [Nocardioides glacieisoli]RYB90243.1 cobalamin-binding protein [Nocardioides glacieisoli]